MCDDYYDSRFICAMGPVTEELSVPFTKHTTHPHPIRPRTHHTRVPDTRDTHTHATEARTWKKECTSHAPPGDLEGQARCAHSRHTHTHTHTRHVIRPSFIALLLSLCSSGGPLGLPTSACAHTLSMRTCHTHSRHTSHMTSLTALPRTAYRTRVCFLSALIAQLLLTPAAALPLRG